MLNPRGKVCTPVLCAWGCCRKEHPSSPFLLAASVTPVCFWQERLWVPALRVGCWAAHPALWVCVAGRSPACLWVSSIPVKTASWLSVPPCSQYIWFSRFGCFLGFFHQACAGALALASRSGYPVVLLVCGYMHVGGCYQLPVSRSGKC